MGFNFHVKYFLFILSFSTEKEISPLQANVPFYTPGNIGLKLVKTWKDMKADTTVNCKSLTFITK